MNETRKKMVSKVFNTYINPNRTGAVPLFEVKSKFNPKGHPDVIKGTRTEDDVLLDFLETFDSFFNFLAETPKQEAITLKDFRNYYSYISFLFENDKEFKAQLEGPWTPSTSFTETKTAEKCEAKAVAYLGLDKPSYKKGLSNKSSEVNMLYACAKEEKQRKEQEKLQSTMQKGESVISSIRKTLVDRGTKGLLSLLAITKELKDLDTEKSGYVLAEDFVNVLKQYQVTLDESSKKLIFNAYDEYNDGLINSNNFLAALIGSLPPPRKALVDELFKNLGDKEVLDKDHIVDCYNPVNHPLVRGKRLSRDDAILDFQAALNRYLEVTGGKKALNQLQFEDFFRFVSAACEREEDFEVIVRMCWDYPEKVKEHKVVMLNPPFDISTEPTKYTTTKEAMSLKKTEEPVEEVNIQKVFNKLKLSLRQSGIRGIFAFQKSLKVSLDNKV
jgi:hypothetical protein